MRPSNLFDGRTLNCKIFLSISRFIPVFVLPRIYYSIILQKQMFFILNRIFFKDLVQLVMNLDNRCTF